MYFPENKEAADKIEGTNTDATCSAVKPFCWERWSGEMPAANGQIRCHDANL